MRTILKNTWTILEKKERKRFSTLIFLGIIISIADIVFLAALLWIIRYYIQPGEEEKYPVWMIGLFFLLFGLKNWAAWLIAKAQQRFTGAVAIRISHQNLENFQHASFREFVEKDSSFLVRRIALQPFDFAQHVLYGLQDIITQACLISIAIIAILIFKAKLFLLLLLILLPPVVVVFYFIRARLGVVKKKMRESNERSFQYLFDSLKGFVEANIYQRNEFFMKRFMEQRKIFASQLFDSLSLQALPGRIIEIFAVLGLFILIVIAKWTGTADSGTLITVGAFMAAAYKIIPGIVKIINLAGQLKAYEFSAEDLQPAFQTSNQIKLSFRPIESVVLKNIDFSYGEQSVLKNINIQLQKKDMLGISGVSGKGKTTLLHVLSGFLKPSKGEIIYNDKASGEKEIMEYWPSVAYVRQQSFFIYDSIVRNITLDEKEVDNEKLEAAINMSGLQEVIRQFPEGIQKIITENGKNISGGQQQRIAIARALYKNADLILLDEPFNELDEPSTESILTSLKDLSEQGKIIILITHDKNSLRYCNKHLSLDE